MSFIQNLYMKILKKYNLNTLYSYFWKKNSSEYYNKYFEDLSEIIKYINIDPNSILCTIGTEDVKIKDTEKIKKIKTIIDATRIETYQQYLNELMNQKDLTASYICLKSNIDIAHFSKISSGLNNKKPFIPKRILLIRIAIAMELSLNETFTLLCKAGYTLNPNTKTDRIFICCLENKIYSTDDIDGLLHECGLPELYKSPA